MQTARPPLPAEVRRIVLLWIGRLGDFIITTPVIHSIRRRFPKARILLVAGQGAYEAARLCPDLDDVRVLRRFTAPMANIGLAGELIAYRADLLIDLNSSFSRASAALAIASRAKLKMAFVKKSANQAYHFHLPMPAEKEPMLDRYSRLAQALDADYDPKPFLPVPPADLERARELLKPYRGKSAGERLIAIHPGNFKKFDNRWPEGKVIELVNRLIDVKELNLLFMAGPGEESRVAAIVSDLKKPLPVLAPMPLGLTAAVLALLDLLIVNVTGTTHLAVATDTPTFSFRSRYTDTVWMPHQPPHYGIASESWTSCRDISVADAWSKLADVLKNLPRRLDRAG